MARRKFKFTLPLLSDERVDELFKQDVEDNSDFQSHTQEVSDKLNIDKTIIRDVLVHYFKSTLKKMNTDHKYKAIFSIFGYLNIQLERTNNLYNKTKWQNK